MIKMAPTLVAVVQFCRSEFFRFPSTFTAVTTAIIPTAISFLSSGRQRNHLTEVCAEGHCQRRHGAGTNDEEECPPVQKCE